MQHAITSHARPMRAFSVRLRSPAGAMSYTAIARSSGDALNIALTNPALLPPFSANVKPVGSSVNARRVAALKGALSCLVE